MGTEMRASVNNAPPDPFSFDGDQEERFFRYIQKNPFFSARHRHADGITYDSDGEAVYSD